MAELKKANDQQEKELFDLKSRYRDKLFVLEKEKQEIILINKELEFSLKQQKLSLESEKLEIISELQRVKSDKLASEQALKSYENDKSFQKELKKYQNDLSHAEIERN